MARPKLEITPELLSNAESYAAQGMTQDQIARCLGIAPGTLYRYKRKNKQFSDAIKTGQAKGVAVITNSLFENAKKGNVVAQIFYLKNRAPEDWRDRRDFDHVVSGEVTKRVINASPPMTEDEWQQKHATSSGNRSPARKPH